MAKVLDINNFYKQIEDLVLKVPVRWDCPTEHCSELPRWLDYMGLAAWGVPQCPKCNALMIMKDVGHDEEESLAHPV